MIQLQESVADNLSWPKSWYDRECQICPRLGAFLQTTANKYPEHCCQPVPPFGDPGAKLQIVGLAPGMHGANATGRAFTGDFAGKLLYQTLYKYGYANKPTATALNDGLELGNCRITNAVKCLPPANKPVAAEINNCNTFLSAELAGLPTGAVILALGRIAHDAVLRAYVLRKKRYPFGHNAMHHLPGGIALVDSYHCSRYNTQTRRLTPAMFEAVFERIRTLLYCCSIGMSESTKPHSRDQKEGLDEDT